MPTLQEQADQIMQHEFRSGQFSIAPSYGQKLKKAVEEGLLIFIKYVLVVALAYFAIQYASQVISGAANGTNAVLYLNELQNKGWLPRVVNGIIPENENAKTIK